MEDVRSTPPTRSVFMLHVPSPPSSRCEVVSAENSMATSLAESSEQGDQRGDTMVAVATTDGVAPSIRGAPVRLCSRTIVLYCVNLCVGLCVGQIMPEALAPSSYQTWAEAVRVVTMLHLSYIVINVGFEFNLDKSRLSSYGKDYLVAMASATCPWILVSLYFMFALGEAHNLHWQTALIAGRFAAPTSAGILFAMLEAAGMKKTWLFQKARILVED